MELSFPEIVLTIGLLLMLVAGLSGLARGTVLSISLVAVAAGMLLNSVGITDIGPRDPAIIAAIELALIFTLFSDGQIVERELLVGHVGPTARALVLALPATVGLIAVMAKLLFSELGWDEALLLGAVLAPTDPVITSAVVGARAVPAKLRHVLNLESGLNDGLALPFVLVFIAIGVGEGGAGEEAGKLIGEAFVGAILGYLLAYAGGRAIEDLPGVRLTPKYEGIYALGIALAAFGLAESTIGNGFIAVFVAGVSLAIADRESPKAFHDFNESIGAILQTVTFFIFGGLVIDAGVPSPAVAALALVLWVLLVARPAAIMAALAGSDLEPLQRRFLAWFGPKGVASMLFALFVLKSGVPGAELIFQLASLIILASIVAHGLTDTIGARWIERRLEAQGGEEESAPA
ncbi:MAG TPA: cation:proton antiporter [Solirubrobacterales bacterium]|nr:cation:proton antiporter [Solirubrobacterales bacterium]